MRRSQRDVFFARLGDPARMLSILNRELPRIADGSVRVTGCSSKSSKSRDSIRAGRLDILYTVQTEVDGGPREHVVLGVAPVKPGFLEDLGEKRHALRGHPWVAPFREAAVFVEELKLALLLFPLDPALPALAELSGSEGAHALAGCLPECRAGTRIESVASECVRYRPLDRAVLKLIVSLRDPQGVRRQRTVFAKLFADDLGAECFRNLTALRAATQKAACLRVPEPLGYDAERRMLLLGAAPGQSQLAGWVRCLKKAQTLPAGVDLKRVERCLLELERALQELQRSGIAPTTRRTFRYELRRAKRDRDLLANEMRAKEPEVAACVDELIERLSALAPAREKLVPAHGDFEYHQVVGDERALTIIDWDAVSLANPVFDAANFLGRLLREPRRRPGCSPELEQLGTAFRRAVLDGRQELARDLDLYEALVLTGQVLRSFRGPLAANEAVQEVRNLASAAVEFLDKVSAAGAAGR